MMYFILNLYRTPENLLSSGLDLTDILLVFERAVNKLPCSTISVRVIQWLEHLTSDQKVVGSFTVRNSETFPNLELQDHGHFEIVKIPCANKFPWWKTTIGNGDAYKYSASRQFMTTIDGQ